MKFRTAAKRVIKPTKIGKSPMDIAKDIVWNEHGAGFKGQGMQVVYARCRTDIGTGIVAFTDIGMCWLSLDGDVGLDRLFALWPKAEFETSSIEPHITALKKQPLDIHGTPFQVAVWKELLKIPAGETKSYQEIAKAVGRPLGARAAGGAIGANPVALFIPCHRVIQSSGGLGGFASGLQAKRDLLALESA